MTIFRLYNVFTEIIKLIIMVVKTARTLRVNRGGFFFSFQFLVVQAENYQVELGKNAYLRFVVCSIKLRLRMAIILCPKIDSTKK